jgi:hypothetical protein
LTCRGLLFSPPIMVGTTKLLSQIHENSICRRIRGMMFANTIISHCDLDETSYITVCKMVSRILVSPDSNICMLDPRIGILGIKIIRRLREQEKRNSLTGKELFNLMTNVLSNSRVVRYSDDSSKQFRTKPNTVLAYSEIPPFLSPSVSATKRRKCRKMIFCFNALLPTNESAFTQFSNWKESSSWIFELFDSYLAIGRTTNWNPHSWIVSSSSVYNETNIHVVRWVSRSSLTQHLLYSSLELNSLLSPLLSPLKEIKRLNFWNGWDLISWESMVHKILDHPFQ